MSNTELEERENGVEDFSKIIDANYTKDEKKKLDDIAEKKEDAVDNTEEQDDSIPYRDEKKGFGGKSKLKGSKNLKRALFAFGGLGGFGVIIVIIILVFIASSLKIQNLAQHLLEYNMASVSRSFSSAAEDSFVEKTMADGSEDTFVQSLKDQLGGTWNDFRGATWGKLDQFRPAKVLQNIQQEGRLAYVYDEVDRKIPLPGLGKRMDLKAIRVDGQDINIADIKTGHYFSNLNERLRFGAELDVGLEKALPDVGNIVRSKVARNIQADLGVELKWWEKLGRDYAGLKEDAAFRQQQQEAYAKIKEKPLDDCAVTATCDAAAEASKTEDKAVKDGSENKTDLATVRDEASASVTEQNAEANSTILNAIRDAVANNSLSNSILSGIKTASVYYQIALPVCMIYDASVVKSNNTIDTKSTADQRAFYAVETASDQQKAGDTTSEAVGAMNDKLGDISQSIPEQRSYNRPVNTLNYIAPPDQPQNGGLGEINSIVNVLGGNNLVTSFANAILSHCGVILDWRTASVAVLAQILALIVSGGGSGAAEGETEVAAGTATTVVTEDVIGGVTADLGAELGVGAITPAVDGQLSAEPIRSFTDKAKDMLLKMGRDTILLGGMSIIAKLMVLAKMGGNTTGLETDGSFANRADVGGNLQGNELHRQALMGRPLDPAEQVASRLADEKYIADQAGHESFSQRYLAIDNADSLLANVSFKLLGAWDAINVKHSIFFTKLLNFGDLFSAHNLFGSILLGDHKAMAAATNQTGNYGIIQWGWSNDELNLINNNPSYRPVVNSELYARNPQKDAIEKQYASCFKESIGNLMSDGAKDTNKKSGVIKNSDGTIDGNCTPQNLGPNNPTYGDGVFRYRLTKRNDYVLDHLNDIQNPEADPVTAATGP